MRRVNCLSALRRGIFVGAVSALSAVLSFVAVADGSVVFHNGTTDSTPAGTGSVDVTFTEGTALLGATNAFSEFAQHNLLYTYDGDNNPGTALITQTIIEIVTNNTNLAWSSYRVILAGADFFGQAGTDLLASATNPVELNGVGGDASVDINAITGSTISVADSNIVRNDGQNAVLTINFGDFVNPGESFRLRFDVGDIGDPGVPGVNASAFQILQQPTAAPIPEPTAAFILLAGSVFGVIGRRSRR